MVVVGLQAESGTLQDGGMDAGRMVARTLGPLLGPDRRNQSRSNRPAPIWPHSIDAII